MVERRGVQGNIRNAAERAGYYPREIDELIKEPERALTQNERESLRFTLTAAETFVNVMQGKRVDHRGLVRFANQLRDIANAPKDEEKLTEWKRQRDDAFDVDEVDSSQEPKIDFIFEEEQRLLLVKNLLEEAFFNGDLTELDGEAAGAIAFFANRLAKVINRMTPSVQNDFAFNERKFDKLLKITDEFYSEHFGAAAEQRNLEGQLQEIDNRIFTEDDPRVIRYNFLEEELGIHLTPGVEMPGRPYLNDLRAMNASLLLLQFDTIVPTGIVDSGKVKDLLMQSYQGLSDPTRSRVALLRLVEFNVCPAWAFARSEKKGGFRDTGHYEQESKEMKAMLVNFVATLRSVQGKKRASLEPLIALVEKLTQDPGEELGKLIVVERDKTAKRREREELYKNIMSRPLNPALLNEKVAVNRALRLLEDRDDARTYNAYYDSRRTFTSASRKEEAQTFWLYFIKDYMVAVDESSKPDFRPEDFFYDTGSKVINTHSFGDPGARGLFSDVHYRNEFLPLAQAIVTMQRAKRKEKMTQT